MKKNLLKIALSLNMISFSNYYYNGQKNYIYVSEMQNLYDNNENQTSLNNSLHMFDTKNNVNNSRKNVFIPNTPNRKKAVELAIRDMQEITFSDIESNASVFMNSSKNVIESFDKLRKYTATFSRDDNVPVYDTGLEYTLKQDNIISHIDGEKYFNINEIGDFLGEMDETNDIESKNSRFWNIVSGAINDFGCSISFPTAQCGNAVEQNDELENIEESNDLNSEVKIHNIYINGLNFNEKGFDKKTWERESEAGHINNVSDETHLIYIDYEKYFTKTYDNYNSNNGKDSLNNTYINDRNKLLNDVAKKIIEEINIIEKNREDFMSIEPGNYIDNLIDLLDRYNIKLNLIGHSFGGVVNIMLANNITDYVNTIINIGTPNGNNMALKLLHEIEENFLTLNTVLMSTSDKVRFSYLVTNLLIELFNAGDGLSGTLLNALNSLIVKGQNLLELVELKSIIPSEIITYNFLEEYITKLYDLLTKRKYALLLRGDVEHFNAEFDNFIDKNKDDKIKTVSMSSGIIAGLELSSHMFVRKEIYGFPVYFMFTMRYNILIDLHTDFMISTKEQSGSHLKGLYKYNDRMNFLAGLFYSNDEKEMEKYNSRNLFSEFELGDDNIYLAYNKSNKSIAKYIPHARQSNNIDFYKRRNEYLNKFK